MIINKNETRNVEAILVKILHIFPDGHGKLVIEMEHIDSKTGLGTNDFFSWSASLYGLKNPNIENWSVGNAVGSIISAYADEEGYFDLLNLEGNIFWGFAHFSYSIKNGTWYTNIYDLFPISNLQFPWLNQTNRGGNQDEQ